MIVAVVGAVTADVLIVKVAVVVPPTTVTDAGTTALVELLDKTMTAPAVGAGPRRVTVPVELRPPTTEVGETVRLVRVAGVIVNVADREVVPRVALITAAVDVATAVVFTVNVEVVAPAATVTLAGSVALRLLEPRLTIAPPVGAGPVRVMVPVELVLPTTEAGDSVSVLS